MPRIYRLRKDYEKLVIREFVGTLGYEVTNAKWSESPDAILTLKRGGKSKRIAIEHTDYFSDTVAGNPSPLNAIDEFWRETQFSLTRRISHRKHLTGILARVTLNVMSRGYKAALAVPTDLAKELVNFVEAHPVKSFEHLIYHSRNFIGYPHLLALVQCLLLSRWTDDEVVASRCHWTCNNTTSGMIGLNLENIKSSITQKNKKAVNYKWNDAIEKWLLIVAGGHHFVSSHAGLQPQQIYWSESDLLALCHSSPFDKIVFWERSEKWSKWLKPA